MVFYYFLTSKGLFNGFIEQTIFMHQTILPYNYEKINDYRLILDTPLIIKKKVGVIKTIFDLEYRGTVIAGGNPHIYLSAFTLSENDEDVIAMALEKVALGFMPFKIQLKDFGCLNNSEIFIPLTDGAGIEQLTNKINPIINRAFDVHINSLARITIGKNLQPWQFNKSWNMYKNEHFSATFIAKEMLLLKRMDGYKSWQILHRLTFENLAIENT